MSTPIGRTKELDRIAAALEEARRLQVARTLRLVGNSGIGKSTVAAASIERAHDAGWLAVLETAHRVQARLPFALARRIGAGILAALGERSELFAAGLPSDFTTERDGAKNEEALYRLIEAVLLDFPLLVAVDDMQWCDPESLSLLLRLLERFADQRFALLSVERLDEPGWEGLAQSDASIVLEALGDTDARALARSLLPGASDEAIARIAEISAGRAIDIVAIADSLAQGGDDIAAVAAGLRAVVARDLALITPERREFLQMLALMEEPISLALLQHLWSEEHFLPLLQASSGRYLMSAPTGIVFRHAALAQAIRETIAIDVPYRRRIIAAISKLPAPMSSDLEQIIAQARACGDRDLELRFAKKLADFAMQSNALSIAVKTMERCLELTPFFPKTSLPDYSTLARLYCVLNDERAAIDACERGLAAANATGTNTGIGPLVASLLAATWTDGNIIEFKRISKHYSEIITDEEDRIHLSLALLLLATYEFNIDDFDREFSYLSSLPNRTHETDLRMLLFDAQMGARCGDYARYERASAGARNIASRLPQFWQSVIMQMDNLTQLHYFGTNFDLARATFGRSHLDDSHIGTMKAAMFLAQGNVQDVLEIASDSLLVHGLSLEIRAQLGLATAACVIAGTSLPNDLFKAVEHEAQIFLSEEENLALLPIAAACAAFKDFKDHRRSRKLLEKALRLATRSALAPQMFFLPVLLSIAANRLNDEPGLALIAEGRIETDKQPWSLAHARLAQHCAKVWHTEKEHHGEAAFVRQRLQDLGSSYFATLLPQPGRSKQPISASLPVLSRREREILELIAAGSTNRSIAEQLTISERTVEGHVANLFNKVGSTSRSQLVAWHLRQVSPVA